MRWLTLAALFGGSVTLGTIGSGLDANAINPAPTLYGWPEFANSPDLTGVSADPTISTANASTLGVTWMDPLGPALDSPMAAYNSTTSGTVAYVGGFSGFFEAVDATTGAVLWSDAFGHPITSSALVEGSNVWIAPSGANEIFKLNSSTGAVECSAAITGTVLSTPTIGTPPGGTTSLYFAGMDSHGNPGPLEALNESNCSHEWTWANDVRDAGAGIWDPLSFAVDANGTGLVLHGSADPDSTIYAVNAITGKTVWDFETYTSGSEDWDIGAGVDVSAPGVNGFADGVAYVEGKDGILYALDLTTGALVWQFNFGGNGPGQPTHNTNALATVARAGNLLVFGDSTAIYGVDATTGLQKWMVRNHGVIDASATIAGPSGQQVAAFGDLKGVFHVINVQNGQSLYTYQTGNVITSSAADVNGHLLVASDDGFLYDFGLGGGSGAAPSGSITSPSAGATLPNPDGSDLTISGTATSPGGVGAVDVELQMDGADGTFYQPVSGRFAPGLTFGQATLADPGGTSTTWQYSVPVPQYAASYNVMAFAVGTNGIADATAFASASNADAVAFNVQANPLAPVVTTTPARVPPGGSVSLSSSGFTAGEQVTFTMATSGGTVTLADALADGSGNVGPVGATVPTAAPFGADAVYATGATSGDVTSGSVYVSNDDPQLGYGPLHQGFETNDNVIAKYQGVATKLSQNWTFQGQGAFDTTPAIDQGLIYFGDEAGYFYAVNETSGAVAWKIHTVNPIESNPAVDSGLVFYGGDGGDIHADNAQTGTGVWRQYLGGKVSSPAVAGGSVYVGTSQGNLVALNETSGAVEWTVAVGGSITSAPAVDTTAGLVVATSSSGAVEAVKTSNGVPAWTHPLGAAATGSMIDAGDVYAASASGNVFALTETSGVTSWTKKVANSITAAPILAFGRVAIGDLGGTVSYFDTTTGKVTSTESQFGYPITGLSFTGSDIMLTSSTGNLGMIQGAGYTLMSWKHSSTAGYASPAVFLNGDVFVLGEDGFLRAFTTPNRPIA